MGGSFIRRGAAGLAVFMAAGVLALSGTAAADHGPFFATGEGAAISFDDPSHVVVEQPVNYDAYRVRVTVAPSEAQETSGDYEVVVQADEQVGACAYTAPLDAAQPFSDDPEANCADSQSTEGGELVFLERTANVPSVFCLTMVVASIPWEGDVEYSLTAQSTLEGSGPHFTAEEIAPTAPCGPEPTTLVAEPALLEVDLGKLALPLGTMIAQLTSDGAPVPGKTISFVGGTGQAICTAVTGPNGVASCYNLLGALLSGGSYGAYFAGDDGYAASTGRGTLIRALGISIF
jgi:hypothetical protein